MPARPHRTVDRVIEILETVSLRPRGVSLAELAAALDAAKSSVQELTNGLLARGYLIECDRRFHLGPGPFILAARANKLAAVSLDHQFVAELAQAARLHRPRRGARRGRHRLHRPRRRRITQPHIRRPHPRPSPALYQRRRKDFAGQRPRRRDVPPPRPWRVRSRRARFDNSSPSSPRSAPADSPSIGELRSRTRSPWPRCCWRLTAV